MIVGDELCVMKQGRIDDYATMEIESVHKL